MSNNPIIQERYQYSQAVANGDNYQICHIKNEMGKVVEAMRLRNAVATIRKEVLRPAEITLRILSNLGKKM